MNPAVRTGLWPFFADKVDQVLAQAAEMGLPPCDAFMGLRSHEQQDALYAKGRTVKNTDGVTPERPMGITVTNSRGGESWHNYGVAVDIVFRPGGKWSWDYRGLPYDALGAIVQAAALEWGGAWPEPKTDMPHAELRAGLLIARAQALYAAGGLPAVWSEIQKRMETA